MYQFYGAFLSFLALESLGTNYNKRGVWTKSPFVFLGRNKLEFGTTWDHFVFGWTIPLTEQTVRMWTLVPYQTRLNQQRIFALHHMSPREEKKKNHQTRREVPDDISLRSAANLNWETCSKRVCVTLSGVCVWKCAGVWLCVSFDWALFTL